MNRILTISEDTTAFPWSKRTPGSGVVAMIAVAVALLAGWATGHTGAGAIAAGAAFTVGFAVFHEALASWMLSMLAATLGIASATLIGSLAAPSTPLVLLVAFVAAVNYGLLAELGPTEGWIGQQSGVFAIVASYFSNGPHYAVGRAEMVLAGGGLQILIFFLFYLLRPKPREAAFLPHEQVPRRLGELWQCLREEVLVRHHSVSYVVRLSIVLLTSTEIYRHFHVRNGYWIPMTALLVLKPQWANTLSRGIARMLGTVAGAGFALLLVRLLPFPAWLLPTLVLVGAWGCYALQAVNYAAFSIFVTLYIVFLFRFGGFSEIAAAHIRLVNTIVGGTLALTVDAIWKMAAARRRRAHVQDANSVQ